MSLQVSAIICTHNRADMLSNAIQSLLSQTLPPEHYEVIVVDNHCTDDSAALAQAWQKRVGTERLRLLHEPRLGLSHARNTGLRAAAGEIIAFMDDDGVAEASWLAELMNAYDAFPDAWAIGGKIVPAWEGNRPSWLIDSLLPQLSMLDLGDTAHLLEKEEMLFGANCSFRQCAFEELGLFRTDLGRYADQMLGSEETEYQKRILQHGKSVAYTPHAVVHHCVVAERLQKRYFARLAHGKGRTSAVLAMTDPWLRSTIVRRMARGGLGVVWHWLMLAFRPSDERRQLQCMRVTAHWAGFTSEVLMRGRRHGV